MSRYINHATIRRTNSKKRYYETVIPDNYKPVPFPRVYTARMGDRWDTLAYKYLGSASLWYVVARANNALNGSIFIKPGTVIIIPEN